MACPALAADAEASAIRTRAWGETGRGMFFAVGFAFAAVGFLRLLALAGAGLAAGGVLSAGGSGDKLVSGAGEAGVVSAEGRIEAEILLGDLFLPDGDLAIAKG